jgi:hypothetical protein
MTTVVIFLLSLACKLSHQIVQRWLQILYSLFHLKYLVGVRAEQADIKLSTFFITTHFKLFHILIDKL